jgi:hypothetical protein
VEFLSDPPSDTDKEEKDRVTEAGKFKHLTLNIGNHPNDRSTNMATTDLFKRNHGCTAL